MLELLNSHVSVRKFTDTPIMAAEELVIVETAQRSPTSSNLQTYSIVSIRNQDTKKKLAELCGNQSHIAASALFLVFCADLHRLERISKTKRYKFNGDSTEMFIVSTVDTALVAGRALITAQSLGIGGVMVGAIRNHPDEVAGLLSLPDFVYPVMGLSLGYPAAPAHTRPRLPLDAIYHREVYSDDRFDEAVSEYDAKIDELGHLKGREVQPDLYPEFGGVYSWSEHSARRMANDNETALRPFMLNFLQKRGFLRR
jgi:nitroreductase